MNLSEHFPDLKKLKISNTNLRFLVAGDLDGLKLKEFDASWNPIEEIVPNFFKGQDKLQIISFFYCHLMVIDPNVLQPLTNLEFADFKDNICTSFEIYGSKVDSNDAIAAELNDKCRKEFYIGKLHNEICDLYPNQTEERVSFARENIVVISSFFAISSFALLAIILRIFAKGMGNNWRELKESLV